MEYKLIQMYDSINSIWNTNKDTNFDITYGELNMFLWSQACWLCFDTAYSTYSRLFQVNKKNSNAGSLSKFLIKILVNVDSEEWEKTVEKHPTLIVNTTVLSRYAIDFIEDVIQFIFAIICMYISIYYSNNHIILAYCVLLGVISLSGLFYFRVGIQNDKLNYAKMINRIDEKKRKSMPSIAEYIRRGDTIKASAKISELVDKRVTAENLTNRNLHKKSHFTQMFTRMVFCLIRLVFISFCVQMKTSAVHRQYILLTIGANSANEIISRMNNLINTSLNAEKNCHRILESINSAEKIQNPSPK